MASFYVFISMWGILDFFVPAASRYRCLESDDLSSWFEGDRNLNQFLWYTVPLVVRDRPLPPLR